MSICEELDSDALNDAITQALANPKEVSGDAGRVVNHSLGELVTAHRYLRGLCPETSGLDRPQRGLRITRLVSPGAV